MIDGTDVGLGGFAIADADDGDDAGRKTGRLATINRHTHEILMDPIVPEADVTMVD